MSESTNIEKQIDDFKEEPIEETSEKQNAGKTWDEMKFIPNKKRFNILAIVITLIELGGLFIFAFAFPDSREIGLNILGLLLVPPFMGVVVSYFVEHKKEAFAISLVNAAASILPYMITHSLIEVFVYSAELLDIYYFLFPFLGIGLQVAVAFTMSRVRNLYRMYGDPDVERETDEAMIAELRESRVKRGLEEPVIIEKKEEAFIENSSAKSDSE